MYVSGLKYHFVRTGGRFISNLSNSCFTAESPCLKTGLQISHCLIEDDYIIQPAFRKESTLRIYSLSRY